MHPLLFYRVYGVVSAGSRDKEMCMRAGHTTCGLLDPLGLYQRGNSTCVEMSDRIRSRSKKRDVSPRDAGIGKTCVECMKYSRNTLFCTKERKVTAQGRAACVFFTPRHQGKSNRLRRE